MEKLKIVIGGYIGLYPTGGASWDYIQYPLGLKLLGHDVYYIEDTKRYPIYQKDLNAWEDATESIQYLSSVMNRFGMKDRWAYRDIASGKSYGLSEHQIIQICKSADVFINISCSTFMREEYLNIPHRMLIDSDPMFTQIQYWKEMNAEVESKVWTTKSMIENHNYLFTFGENINDSSCFIPKFDYKWIPTRQPVCIDYWSNNQSREDGFYTTVMNWAGRNKLLYNNEEWGQKDVEFKKFKTIPHLLPDIKFKTIINAPTTDLSEFISNGWDIFPNDEVPDMDAYQDFIFKSTAEFSVAKETYVKSNSGWFSCRSACYLASSKPVITQETGWSKYIPSGNGLFTFTDLDSAVDAIKKVKSDYKYHSHKARDMAREYFSSDLVLKKMIDEIY